MGRGVLEIGGDFYMIRIDNLSLELAFGIQTSPNAQGPWVWFYPCGHAKLVITSEDATNARRGCICTKT